MGRVLVLALLIGLSVVQIESLPVSAFLDDSDYDSFEDDFDVVYDQRQNGTANVRVAVDGVVVSLPGPDLSPSTSGASALLDLFASQMASGGSEYDLSEESNESPGSTASTGSSTTTAAVTTTGSSSSISTSSSSSSSSSSTTTTSASTTTAIPPLFLSNDLALQSLPASLLGQGLSFLFNAKKSAEIPFRLNVGGEPGLQTVPVLVADMDSTRKVADGDSNDSQEDEAEVRPSRVSHSSKRKRKHKRKYKVHVASMLRPLLRRGTLLQ
ncbi:nuclear pore complex protein DDB_G0274915-like [Anopheles aquasalis]|uniref:nuclear pore complex protein DDB_G0274915-like n=1 Tax=Anopheles aquasalis TaxID=42839 RepID=UPI00215A6787|nr:nuclear pore complex protein DDB_G0274915-like [Anopheles aquasalis]